MIKYSLFLIYPLILLITFFLIYRKYKSTIINNYKQLIINTIVISIIICSGLFIFFKFENTIYSYDYSGHWIRALEMKSLFINEPQNIFTKLYESMITQDYSYLPALFIFPSLFIREGFSWFCISSYLFFLLPSIILLQIIYFNKVKLNKYLPILLTIIIYSLYLPIFYGKVDSCGLFFILSSYALIILSNLEDIDIFDNLSINLFAFISIFLRRWYLYAFACLYLIYLIKILYYKRKETKYYFGFILSFIIMALVIVLFFNTFIQNVLNNNFAATYEFYNRGNKLLSFVYYLSPIIIVVSLIGAYRQFKTNKYLLIANVISIIIPCLMIWKIQSFEYHHYYVFLINVIFLFISGIIQIYDSKKIIEYLILLFMTIQTAIIFTYAPNLYIFTDVRKNPEVLSNKEELINLSEYIKSLETSDDISVFVCGGSYGIISDDLLRNALLPNIDMPNIDSSVFDLRDGFPKDMEYIRYVIIINPALYMDENYQHMYTIINNAIQNDPLVSSIYNKVTSMRVNDRYVADIYEKTGDFTPEIKEYFYNQMISYYPDYKEEFKYILE